MTPDESRAWFQRTYNGVPRQPWGEAAHEVNAPWAAPYEPDKRAVVTFVRAGDTRIARVVVTDADLHIVEVMLRTMIVEYAATQGEHINPDEVIYDLVRDGYDGGWHIACVGVARVATNLVDLRFYEWGFVLDPGEGHPLRTARVEMDNTGTRWYNAEGMMTMEFKNPEPEPAEDSMRRALDREYDQDTGDVFPTTTEMRMIRPGKARTAAWVLLVLAIIGAAIFGIVEWVAWGHRQDARDHAAAVAKTNAAIKACGDGGGHYLYGDNQLVRLSHTVSGYPNYDQHGAGYKSYTAHIDYVASIVPHTHGGICLTPEDTVAGR